jgi:6-phosphogluconolactonase
MTALARHLQVRNHLIVFLCSQNANGLPCVPGDDMNANRPLKKEGRLLARPWITPTKTSRLGLAQGGAVVRGWLSVFSMLAIGLVCLAAPLRAQFAYVVNESSPGSVSAYRIGTNGALTPVAGSPFAAGNFPVTVAVDPAGKFAYVTNGGDNNVSAYRIGANGALTPVAGSPFATGNFPVTVAVDPTGKFAYVADFNLDDNKVSAFSIGANGALTPVAGSPFVAGSGSHSVAVDPTARFAYVTNERSNNVSAYSIGADGALTPVAGSPFAAGSNPGTVTVDPTGKFAYVVNLVDNNVSAYSIGAKGALTPVAGSPFAAGREPFSVAVNPTGKFAYVVNLVDSNVSAYRIGADGALTQVAGSPFAAGFLPFSVAVNPTGKFAYVTNGGDNNVSAYSIGADGALTPVPGSPFAAGQASSVAITPLVPFASSFAKLEISRRGFDLDESFTLGANSNGIDPVTENMTLQIGTFSVTIPSGSFQRNHNERFTFQGGINGLSLHAQITPLGNNIFTFKAETFESEGRGVDLTDLSNPVDVVLTIGKDSGSTAVTAQFRKRKEDHEN